VSQLIEALKDEDWGVRKAAARALREIKDPRAVPALCKALKDEHTDVRGMAVWALQENQVVGISSPLFAPSPRLPLWRKKKGPYPILCGVKH